MANQNSKPTLFKAQTIAPSHPFDAAALTAPAVERAMQRIALGMELRQAVQEAALESFDKAVAEFELLVHAFQRLPSHPDYPDKYKELGA